MPTAQEIAALVLDVEARIKEDATAMREAPRYALEKGRLQMEPMPDLSYRPTRSSSRYAFTGACECESPARTVPAGLQ
jgi:hypothetical protein